MSTRPHGLPHSDGEDGSPEALRRRADRLAHDFTNLLTTILGYANLLSRSLDEGDPRRADVEEIIAGAQRASGLVRELDWFGRVEPGPGSQASLPATSPATGCGSGMEPTGPMAPLRARVLVVDDERTVRYLVRTILARAGHDVFEAATADAAESWLAGQPEPVDLLIADVVLPGSSGPDLLARLRRRQPALKVLFISGYSDEHIRRDPRIEAGTAFVQKPFGPEGLTDRVRRVLSS